METAQTHSKAKLALGIFTSPTAAFEEVLRRKLLTEGLWIAFFAGMVTCVVTAARAYDLGPVHLFGLGRSNPVTWMGLLLLYGLAMHFLLNWLGTQTKYAEVLMVMGWAQMSLLVAGLLNLIETGIMRSGTDAPVVSQSLAAAGSLFQIAYLVLIGIGIRAAFGATIARGILAYVLTALAASIGFMFTYGRARLDLFADSSPGISEAARALVASDSTAWLAGSVVGLAAGMWHLGKSLEWKSDARIRAAVSAGLLGAALFAGYYYLLWKTDFYGQLLSANRFYQRQKYAEAAKKLEKLVPHMRGEALALALDVADFSFAAGNDAKSAQYFRKALRLSESTTSWQKNAAKARAHSGLGMVNDIRGDYRAAVKEFEKSAKLWPEFRDPWVRLALTYARMGENKKAIEKGEHAVNKLGSEAAVAWVALTQAYAAENNTKKAEAAAKKVGKLNKDLHKKIGKTPAEWTKATTLLTRSDLKFPLEKQTVQSPRRPQPRKR